MFFKLYFWLKNILTFLAVLILSTQKVILNTLSWYWLDDYIFLMLLIIRNYFNLQTDLILIKFIFLFLDYIFFYSYFQLHNSIYINFITIFYFIIQPYNYFLIDYKSWVTLMAKILMMTKAIKDWIISMDLSIEIFVIL